MANVGYHGRRRREAQGRFEYRDALERLANFVDNEFGNERAPRPRPRPDDGEWRVQRAKTIRRLNELRQKLDTVCVGANCGKAAGNGAEIAGAAAAMVGAVLSLFRINCSQTIMNIGNLVHHSGTMIDGVSNVVESLVSANYLREIKAELERDRELSRPLADWLDFSRELDANVQEIFGVSLASEKLNAVIRVFYEFSKLSSSARGFDATMDLIRQGRYSLYIRNYVKLEKLQKFFHHLSTSPRLGERVRKTLSALSAATGTFQVAREGIEVYRSIMGASSSLVPSLLGGPNLEAPTVGAVASFGIFQAINMAVSVVSLINTTSIIKNGTSKYSDALQQLTRALSWELRRMEDL